MIPSIHCQSLCMASYLKSSEKKSAFFSSFSLDWHLFDIDTNLKDDSNQFPEIQLGSSWDSGDEGNALGGSYMVFHWQCDLAPSLQDSGSSRYLITTVPSTAYVYDHDVNITLQSVAQHICRSLADLRISIPMTGVDSDSWHDFFKCRPPLLCPKPASSVDPNNACSPWRYGVH